jgi:carbonic anhydrase
MKKLEELLERNAAWAASVETEQPGFFERLARLQAPKYLWIGCADSRVPANEITGLLPGEIFVHRNIANVVVHTDLNCLSVIQFAVDVLKVEHIMVVGHYGCGGVNAALHNRRLGLVDNWIRHVQDVRDKHLGHLQSLKFVGEQEDRLCELNALEQVLHVCETSIVQDAWARGQSLSVHSWIYGLITGRVRDLGMTASCAEDVQPGYEEALARLHSE